MNTQITIKKVLWDEYNTALKRLRRQVFIEEQNVSEHDEWDEWDSSAMHFLAFTDSTREEKIPVATARLLSTGKLTRMAVLKAYRQQGIGEKLLHHIIQVAKEHNFTTLYADAQIQALGFYTKAGFVIVSDSFLDAGIEHKKIQIELT